MPIEIKVPSVGESISEGNIARWLRKEGEAVQRDEPLFELETEKASQEVPAPASGILRISAAEGRRVAIGSVVGVIEENLSLDEPVRRQPPPPPPRAVPPPPPAPAQPPVVSPAARRLAGESGIAPAQLAGSGKHGVILKEDVQAALEARALPPAGGEAAGVENPGERRERLSAIRQRIADRLLQAQKGSASVTTFNEADMSAIIDLRTRYKDRFKERHGVGLGFMGFFVKACVEAIRVYPIVNARIEGAEIVHPNRTSIGVAVSTDKGLMVPVVRDADRLSLAQIEKQIADMAGRARDGKIAVADLQGGTFTITNGGVFGSMLSTPILNPPQSAILGMHAIQKRPVVKDDQIVIRSMMYLALTYDHRLIDGREAVLFLVAVKECIENPGRLLLDL